MKWLQNLSWTVLILALLVRGVNTLAPLPDWAVRVDGILLILGIFSVAFHTFKPVKWS